MTLPGHAAIALVLGYDQRAGAAFTASSRSDTVMLLRADPVSKTISVLSVPRDLGVPIYCPNTHGGGMHDRASSPGSTRRSPTAGRGGRSTPSSS